MTSLKLARHKYEWAPHSPLNELSFICADATFKQTWPLAHLSLASKTSRGSRVSGVICFLIIDAVCMGSENSFSRRAPQEWDKGRCSFLRAGDSHHSVASKTHDIMLTRIMTKSTCQTVFWVMFERAEISPRFKKKKRGGPEGCAPSFRTFH